MSWLLFMDESGHDHRTMPYEVTGGIALHAERLWPFICAVRSLEQSIFGAHLHEFGSEIKGSKLLNKKRIHWARQGPPMDEQARRKHALNFLNATAQGRTPRRDEFTAYGQACVVMAERALQLLSGHHAVVFASFIPPVGRPPEIRGDVPRKDIVFLFERYAYFLQEQDEMGLLVFDQTDKDNDRKLAARMERYFTGTMTGSARAQWVVPSPLFVESDMAYGVQVADLCIYCLNLGYRFRQDMIAPKREEISSFVPLFDRCIWRGQRSRDGQSYQTWGVCYVPDPYTPRAPKRKEEVRPLEPP